MRLTAPAELAVGDRVVVNGHTYTVATEPRREAAGVWVDVDLGGLALPVLYDHDDQVETERPQAVST